MQLPAGSETNMKRKPVAPLDRAAYAASQPLFNALRSACESLEQQPGVLLAARDTAQQVHVRIDKDGTDRCVDYVSLSTYVDVSTGSY